MYYGINRKIFLQPMIKKNGLTGGNFMFKNTKLVMGMLVCMGGTLVFTSFPGKITSILLLSEVSGVAERHTCT
ncbi:MAG: hypothetical protein Ct9H90mP25_1960 [Gammaproteobacteria bacterium]|nr:MAG: hypothetical protein Ct9H90mP25_1960 [Gammaproteobacteria bacterium]